MPTVFEHKELAQTETPLLLFDCVLPSGAVERWSTHQAVVGGVTYAARVMRHNVFEMQAASDQGVDAIPRIAVTLSNVDSHLSQVERVEGFKGAKITVRFLFFDLRTGEAATEAVVLFKGIANPPEEIDESQMRLSAINRMSLQRVLLPTVRLQRRCPWQFPSNETERAEAVDGGAEGAYSRFYRCGYSPADGAGSLNGAVPFTSCNFTRADCEARGMFNRDSADRVTSRFGGAEFVPASVLVRGYREKGSHAAAVAENEARYNDFVPLVYGTGWHSPMVVFARNDGNLTRLGVLIGMGQIEGVRKVLVNDIDVPLGRDGVNMTGTGWYNVVSHGERAGGFDLNFTSGAGVALGDPFGSMAYVSIVVPNRVNDGRSIPTVRLLMDGLRLTTFDQTGSGASDVFTANPAWVLLDVLRRSGWTVAEIDLASFARAAAYCDVEIAAADLYGNPVTVKRFECNLILKSRRSAADVVRGIRNASRLQLTYGVGGKLEARVEDTIAGQHPVAAAWSNAEDELDGGWPSYEFGDGANGTSGILRRANGEPSVRVWSRSTVDTPNRFAVEFQDAFNEYQQDSLSVADIDDVNRTGQEITGTLSVLGVPNFHQAARMLRFHLDRSLRGNVYVEFESSVRVVGIQPGDLIALTYLKEGFVRQVFRVLRIAPGANFRTAAITAQIHDDGWYGDVVDGSLGGSRRQPGAGMGVPRPLAGNVIDVEGDVEFGIEEIALGDADGSASLLVKAGFSVPATPGASGAGIPLVSLSAVIGDTGTIAGDQTLYYAVSAVDGEGAESALSFVVPATVPPGSNTNSVTLTGLSFSSATAGFHVYRGASPVQLARIASDEAVAGSFTDAGLTAEAVPPPDANYHHANFYWRLELVPETVATIADADSVGDASLNLIVDEYRGAVVRITRGRGAGQERVVASNTTTVLTVAAEWSVTPDSSSKFAVAEAAWHFGATGASSPVQFEIPNRTGTVHVTGRAANANDKESPEELATVTRWLIGGAEGGGGLDTGVPPAPEFSIAALPAGSGSIEFAPIAFPTLVNTRTIVAATATLRYWDELSTGAPELASAVDAVATELVVAPAVGWTAPAFVQVGTELMLVTAIAAGESLTVERGVLGSAAAAHGAGDWVYPLTSKTVVLPFVRDFFGSPASGRWTHTLALADVRVASVEMFVTNAIGASETTVYCTTGTIDGGLRTNSGGQYAFTIDGFLAIEDGAVPDVLVEADHSVRDISALVREAPTGAAVIVRVKHDGVVIATLTIASGETLSNEVGGFGLPVLGVGKRISVDVTSVGSGAPGADLTVQIRL